MNYLFNHPSGVNYQINIDNPHVEKGMKANGKLYEYYLLEHIEKQHGKRGNILDIGAHVGNHSIYFGLFCADNVYAFEPQESNVKRFDENIMLNDLDNVKLFPYALGDELCKMGMRRRNDRIDCLAYEMHGKGEYPIYKLDDVVDGEITNIKVIKIDVEGFDCKVLLGGEETIRKNRPSIYIEYAENMKQIDKFLFGLGYKKGVQFRQGTAIQEFIP